MTDQEATIVDGRRDKGLELIKRFALQDCTLSFRARGVLVYLLSMPPGWKTNSQKIADAGKEGRDAIRTALSELEAAGYLARRRRHVGDGNWEWAWLIFDDPSETAEELAERGLDGPGVAKPRPRAPRKPTPPSTPQPENPIPAGQTKDGFLGGGNLGGGNLGGGNLGDIESHTQKEPPKPPAERGADAAPEQDEPPAGRPRCTDHGIAGCRQCGLSVRSAARAERDAEQDAAQAEAMARAHCPGRMCNPHTGTRWDPATHVPLSPAKKCDHRTSHERVLADIAAAEDAEDAARAARAAAMSVEVSSAEARRRARALVAASCKAATVKRKSGAAARRCQDEGTGVAPDGVSTPDTQAGGGVSARETATAGV